MAPWVWFLFAFGWLAAVIVLAEWWLRHQK
jgi:hypothetical protein